MNDWNQGAVMASEKSYVGELQVRNRNIVPNLLAQKDELQKRIAKIDTLLGIFDKNPDFVQFFDLARELV